MAAGALLGEYAANKERLISTGTTGTNEDAVPFTTPPPPAWPVVPPPWPNRCLSLSRRSTGRQEVPAATQPARVHTPATPPSDTPAAPTMSAKDCPVTLKDEGDQDTIT
ncbi:uncharacterized protein LOC135090553 isoform X2 [Scylla paramamosain]|uniref:uncharacterized protein LOC135090553 isoform X2 n=1 Tax=Scylla paramamosain TaxID=85552 RepID=UPI003082D4F6